MRVWALSDLHVDYEANARWVESVSRSDHTGDTLILAGDVSDSLTRLGHWLEALARRFQHLLYLPGNHELWVVRDPGIPDSLEKLERVLRVASDSGAQVRPLHLGDTTIVPLWSWYDFSFGQPGAELQRAWMDFHACRWPGGMTPAEVTAHFLRMNTHVRQSAKETIVSFSHFLPRLDLMPAFLPPQHRRLDPVLGTTALDAQVRTLGSAIHVYGHSHINQSVMLEGCLYVNNAFGYPSETHIAARRLHCIHEVR